MTEKRNRKLNDYFSFFECVNVGKKDIPKYYILKVKSPYTVTVVNKMAAYVM